MQKEMAHGDDTPLEDLYPFDKKSCLKLTLTVRLKRPSFFQ